MQYNHDNVRRTNGRCKQRPQNNAMHRETMAEVRKDDKHDKTTMNKEKNGRDKEKRQNSTVSRSIEKKWQGMEVKIV